MIGHLADDDRFHVESIVQFTTDASSHIDDADEELMTDDRLMRSDDDEEGPR